MSDKTNRERYKDVSLTDPLTDEEEEQLMEDFGLI